MLLAAVLITLTSATAGAATAWAHADFVSTSPEDGASLESSPSEASVRFDSGLLDAGAAFVVTAADGTVVSAEPPQVGDRRLTVALQPDLPPGDYRAAFRVVSEDGHTVSDEFAFTVLAGSTAEAAPSDAASSPAESSPAESSPAASSPAASSPAASSPAASAQPSIAATAASTASTEGGPPLGLIIGAAVLVAVALAAVLLVGRARD